MKTVTFCGHINLSIEDALLIKQKLYMEIEKLIQYGAAEFLFSGSGDFEYMSARAVKELKQKYPYIKSVLITSSLSKEYNENLYDCLEYPRLEKVSEVDMILKPNEYMIKRADVVMSYVKYPWEAGAKTLELAQKEQKYIYTVY